MPFKLQWRNITLVEHLVCYAELICSPGCRNATADATEGASENCPCALGRRQCRRPSPPRPGAVEMTDHLHQPRRRPSPPTAPHRGRKPAGAGRGCASRRPGSASRRRVRRE
uniref:Uncharacterized protein n=1 Tax=Arundo donax TaxID=35708 RepID=A0A0A9GC94_ARUDO